MATLHHQKARNDIWMHGIKTPDAKLKQGYKWDRSRPENEQDVLLVPKGEYYYWWQHRTGPKHISLKEPRKSQVVTESNVIFEIMEIEKELGYMEAESLEHLQAQAKDIYKRLWELHNECNDRREALPLVLQDVGEGKLLGQQSREIYKMLTKIKGIEWPLEQDEDDKWWEKTIPILRKICYGVE